MRPHRRLHLTWLIMPAGQSDVCEVAAWDNGKRPGGVGAGGWASASKASLVRWSVGRSAGKVLQRGEGSLPSRFLVCSSESYSAFPP